MTVNHNEFYHQIIKVQKADHWIQVWFNHDCDEQIHQKNVFCAVSWKNENRKSSLFIWTTHYCKSWNIYRNDIWQKHMIQIEILINVNSIKKNKNKNEYNWTFTNEWSD